MRKILILLIALICCLLLSSCADSIDQNDSLSDKEILSQDDIFTDIVVNGIKLPQDSEQAWSAAGYHPSEYYYWKNYKDIGTHDPDPIEAENFGGREVLSEEFVISTEFSSYPQNTEEIWITLTSTKPTSELELFRENKLPRVDKLVNGKWERMLYMPRNYFNYGEWNGQIVEFADTEYQTTRNVIRTNRLFDPLTPGHYRVTIYLGSTLTPFTAEFDITE